MINIKKVKVGTEVSCYGKNKTQIGKITQITGKMVCVRFNKRWNPALHTDRGNDPSYSSWWYKENSSSPDESIELLSIYNRKPLKYRDFTRE